MLARITFLAGLVALALAGPTPYGDHHDETCKPGTYACGHNPETGKPGWTVCDVNHKEVWGGDCPPKTKCYFNETNQSPYCI